MIHVNFESDPVGPYSDEMLQRDWGEIGWANLHGRARIVEEENAGSNRALRISYPAGALGPSQGGCQFVVPLPPSEELWLSYRVKFGERVDFVLGGKLPGLTSGGGKYSGGIKPKDGDGWSARYMWREGGKAVIYLYSVDMPGIWGEDIPLDGTAFSPGTWHRVTQHIKVNTPGLSDGILDVWFDGRKALSRSDIRFRLGEKALIDSFFFSTFHGGATAEWAPRADSFAFFGDFTIGRTPLEHHELPDKPEQHDAK